MEIKFRHVNIISEDWKKLAEFYITVFNCRLKLPERNLSGDWVDDLTKLKSVKIKGAHLILPGFSENSPTLEIFEYSEQLKNGGKKINKEGLAHLAFEVDDVDACLDMLKKNGGSLLGEVVETEIKGAGKIQVVYARDPEGNIIEIQKWN